VQQTDECADLKIGDIVTVSCLTFSQDGTPVAPKVLKVRTDVTWKDIVGDTAKSKVANGKMSGREREGEQFRVQHFTQLIWLCK
jgi:hypothetical protein